MDYSSPASCEVAALQPFLCFQHAKAMDPFNTTPDMMLGDSPQQLINDVLVWVGFGTLAGLLAKAIMPGRDPGGALATVLMGIGGTMLGCGGLSFLRGGERIVPVSPWGMVVGVVGTLVILFLYKLLGGHYFVEGEYLTRIHRQQRRSEKYRYGSTVYED